MAKISAATRHALSVIAHMAMAQDMDKNVFQKQGVSGFYDNWLKTQTTQDRAIIAELQKIGRQARADFASMMKSEVKS